MKKHRIITGLIAFATLFASCDKPTENNNTSNTEKQKDMKKIAVITGEGFQDQEAYMPIGYFTNRGAEITTIGIEKAEVKSYNSDFTIKIHKTTDEVKVEDFDALIIPGGHAPSKLRKHDDIIAFAKDFYKSGKPVAAICHGPQILITAGLMDGVKATSYKSVKEEMVEAGVNFVDDAPVIDGNLITSRNPDDLAAFCKALEDKLY